MPYIFQRLCLLVSKRPLLMWLEDKMCCKKAGAVSIVLPHGKPAFSLCVIPPFSLG